MLWLYIPALVWATFVDEAFTSDWKMPILEFPRTLASTSSLAVMLSETNFASCFNKSGAVLWTKQLPTTANFEIAICDSQNQVIFDGETTEVFDLDSGAKLLDSVEINGDTVTCGNKEVKLKSKVKSPHKIWQGELVWGPYLEYKVDGSTKFRHYPELSKPVSSIFVRNETQISSNWKLADLLSPKNWLRLLETQGFKPEFGADQVLVVLTEGNSIYGVNTTVNCENRIVFNFRGQALRNTQNVNEFQALVNGKWQTYNFAGELCGDSSELVSALDLVAVSDSMVKSVNGTWSLKLPGTVVSVDAKHPKDFSPQSTIKIDQRKVMYKYLNPHLVYIASYNSTSKELWITIIDALTGRLLSEAKQEDPVLINEYMKVNMVVGEHWVMYTYYADDATLEPKVSMLELFESSEANVHLTDPILPYVSSNTWRVPSRGSSVYALACSRTSIGATTRQIIMAFENQLVAFPKQMFNTLTSLDSIFVPKNGFLSYFRGVNSAQLIATGETNLESTYVLAALSKSEIFFTRSAPSSEFDYLNPGFPKFKLIVCLAFICILTLVLSNLSKNRKLANEWR